jgi:predicted RNase H-like HicB family nuclease
MVYNSDILKENFKMSTKITYMIEKDVESGKYIGSIPYIKGAHTYADSIDELKVRIKEVLELCLKEIPQEERELLPEFEGISQVEVVV